MAFEATMTATNTGPSICPLVARCPQTGRSVQLRFIAISQAVNGQVVYARAQFLT